MWSFVLFCSSFVIYNYQVVTAIAPPSPNNNNNDLVSGTVSGNRSIGIVIGARQSNVGVVLNGSGPITVNTNRDSEGQGAQTTLGSNNGSNNGNNNGNGGGLNNGNGNGVNNVGAVVAPTEGDPSIYGGQPSKEIPDGSGPVAILPATQIPSPPVGSNNGNSNGNGDGTNNGNYNGNNNYGLDADITGVGDGLVNIGNAFAKNWSQFWGWGRSGVGSNNGNNNGNGNGRSNGNHNGNGNGVRR